MSPTTQSRLAGLVVFLMLVAAFIVLFFLWILLRYLLRLIPKIQRRLERTYRPSVHSVHGKKRHKSRHKK